MTIRIIMSVLGYMIQLIALYMAEENVQGSIGVLLLGYAIIIIGQSIGR